MTRFDKLKAKLKERGAKNPAALAAWIGRRKYGKREFQTMAEKGKEDKKEAQ